MPIPPSEKYRMVAIGCPIILQCEVSDPAAQVSWFKDGGELYCKTGLDMKRDGSMRKLIIQSAKLSDSGIYSCNLTDDVVTFHVDVKGDSLWHQHSLWYISFLDDMKNSIGFLLTAVFTRYNSICMWMMWQLNSSNASSYPCEVFSAPRSGEKQICWSGMPNSASVWSLRAQCPSLLAQGWRPAASTKRIWNPN